MLSFFRILSTLLRQIFMLLLFGILAFALNCTTGGSKSDANDRSSGQVAYLFTFFRGNGESGVYLAWSKDGYVFEELNSGQPILPAPKAVGGGLTRDPSMVLGPDGVFHLVWTTGWWQPPVIGVAHSKDLLRWSEPQAVSVLTDEPTALNAWAPEIFFDDASKEYLVIFSSTIRRLYPEGSSEKGPDGHGLEHRLYVVRTKDFVQWTPAKLFYDNGFSVIDGMIAKAPAIKNRYIMVLKDETFSPVPAKNLRLVFSTNALGPWTGLSAPITPAGVWAEGPSINRIDDQWIVYYDRYMEGKYGAVRSSDLVHWQNIDDLIRFPRGARHGTVLTVPYPLIAHLIE